MKSVRQPRESFAQQKEKEPGHKDSADTLNDSNSPRERAAFCERYPGYLSEAGSANDSVVVLGDTFPAKVLFALRTTSHRFARRVTGTTQVSKFRHSSTTGSMGPWQHAAWRWRRPPQPPSLVPPSPSRFVRASGFPVRWR